MKKIRVKTIFGSWQGYQELANYPPPGIEYIGLSKETKEGKYYQKKKWKERINRWTQKLNIPRMIYVKSGNYDIIHTSRGIIPLNKKPWVMDVEYFASFTGLHFDLMLKNRRLRKFIEKKLSSKYCKTILCHCEATKNSFIKYMDCSGFKDKLKVVYPASHIIPIKKSKHKKIRILCMLSLFEQKGGLFILEAFSKLEKKYKNIELWMRSDVPDEIKKKYNSKNIIYMPYFGNIIPRSELIKKIYSQCDIFIYPTFCDSFGFSLIDALVSGLPIITTNLFASPEIVKDKKNGFIIKIPGYKKEDYIQKHSVVKMNKEENEEFIKNLVKNLEKLIKNKKLREKMGKESFKLIKEGKFSIKERNKKLREIYEQALK